MPEPTGTDDRIARADHARWREVRVKVVCESDCYATSYVGGYRLRRLPSADAQARRMR